MINSVGGTSGGFRTMDLTSRVTASDSFRAQLEAAARRPSDIYVSGNSSPGSACGVSEEKLRELAAKYDPRHMTQDEYASFIDELVEEGVLSASVRDKNIIGYGGPICIGQGDMDWGTGMTATNFWGGSDETCRTLSDAKGDVLKWARYTASWVVVYGGKYPDKFVDTVKIREFKKMVPVLDAMVAARR